MKLRRVMIAAPKSGSGKTTITCALLQALKNSGQRAVSYKCGPDYIDPMFHREVLQIPTGNLDTFFTGEEETKALFLRDRREEEIAVLEGVMGLFDGLGGIRREGSSYHLAGVTKTPILLVVDAKGMGYSVIPMIAGFLAYDREKLIRGVLLNRMSKAYYETIKPLIEEQLGITVVGYFPENPRLHMESRHLGLVLPRERAHTGEQLQAAAEALQETVSVEQILRIAQQAEELTCDPSFSAAEGTAAGAGRGSDSRRKPLIAVARDEAFCFYYAENLRMLQEKGAQLAYFSPIHDRRLPEGCCGLLLGGGYPELYAEALSGNTEMLAAVRQAVGAGMPVVAECGGFLYLHSRLADRQGREYPMAGVLEAECADRGKLVRFGYIELEEKQSCFLPPGEHIRGHEFHYFDSQNNGQDCLALKPVTGRSYPCVLVGENCFMGFPHLYYPSNPAFAERFVGKAYRYMEAGRLF
ncbi:MAG: cobyrinate a,c-diamide synthase [Lachnospiraceae bacterium]|nr:cobyrinate a,c-diamide synthase [Lachnospiraceae bacterium]